MSLDNLQSPKLTARVAPLVQPITRARERGLTWTQIVREIGQSVGIDPEAKGAADRLRLAFKAATAQIERGRLKPAQAQAVPPIVPAPGDTKKPVPGRHPSGRHLLPGEKLRDDGLEF
jgi:hypothetical protein